MRIKRIKHQPPGPMDALVGVPPPTVAYALAADKHGNVTGWTTDVSAAAEFDEETVARVRACYASRPGAGQLSFGEETPAPRTEKPARKGRQHTAEES